MFEVLLFLCNSFIIYNLFIIFEVKKKMKYLKYIVFIRLVKENKY